MRTRSIIASVTSLGLAAAVAAAVVTFTGTASAAVIGNFDFGRPNVVASGLSVPWGMGFLPDGSALVAERDSARVVQLRPGQTPVAVATISGVTPGGEGGLLGLAVSPTYAQDQWVYVYYTAASDNRITRFRLSAPQTQTVVLSGLAKATIHDGGRIAFGPDGMLYAGVGDAGTTSNAQNLNSRNGKILRMTPTGGVPSGNPFANSLVWSYGHRNVQGLTWDSQGRMWAAEFGQNTWDEVNQIVAGGNYGWPTVEGMANNSQFRNPNVVWTTAEASPSGLTFANNTLFVASLRGARLWTIPVNANGTTGTPVADLQNQFGRLRTVQCGPDNHLWVSTSNRDGRGSPASTDDRVLRFPAVGPPTSTSPVCPTPTTTTQPTTPPATTPPVTTPPASTPPATTPPATTPPPAGGCTATYSKTGEWQGGFQGQLLVRNTSTSTRTAWTVTFAFPNGQVINQMWGGTYTQSGANVTVRNVSYNGTLAPNATTTAGFLASWNGTNGVPATVSCS